MEKEKTAPVEATPSETTEPQNPVPVQENSQSEKTVTSNQKTDTSNETKKKQSMLKRVVIPVLLIVAILASLYIVYSQYMVPQKKTSRSTITTTTVPQVTTPNTESTPIVSTSKNPTPTSTGEAGATRINGLSAVYFDDLNFAGSSQVKTDSIIDFSWGENAPVEDIGNETYSVRWTGYLLAPASDTFTFTTASDDGIRISINSRIIINSWKENQAPENKGSISLVAGKLYPIKIEYFNQYGAGFMKMFWSSSTIQKQVVPYSAFFLSKTGTGVRTTFFDDTAFKENVKTVVEPEIFFNSKDKRPIDVLKDDEYSVRWEGLLMPKYNQLHTFYVKAGGDIKIWIDNKLVHEAKQERDVQDSSFDIDLKSEVMYSIKIEMSHSTGEHIMQLQWESRSQKIQNVPSSRLYALDLPGEF